MNPFKTRDELMCSEGLTVPASTCITSRVTFITNWREGGKDWIVITTKETHSWSFLP
jgi:hypothetical protein